MELIPGLPNDVAVECLIRVHFNHLSKAASVCKAWKTEMQLHEFWQYRRAAGLTRPVIVMAQARAKPADAGLHQLTICDPERGFWNDLPPIPGFFHRFPVFCQIIGVGTNLVVMGGCDPMTWKVLNSVFIYDFLSSTWRHGADMPGGRRLFFGCASDSDGTVIVAGGHDEDKNALRSAMIYDVAKDEWIMLPDMTRERDECKCIFHHGKFHVIGGYCTERQGGFERHAEMFDDRTWQWGLVNNFLETAMWPGSCVSCSNDRFYMWQDSCLAERNDATWTTLSGLPADVSNISYLTAWRGKLLAIGCAKSGGSPDAYYVINLSDKNSTKIQFPQEYSGHVQSVSFLEV